MDKRALSERDICTKFITPALRHAGWDEMLQIREEVGFTKGRIIVRGKLVTRGKAKRADYILYFKPNIPLALIEAKDNSHSVGGGMFASLDDFLKRWNAADRKQVIIRTEKARRPRRSRSRIMLLAEPLTESVIGLAIEVHCHTGPGLLESVYEQCLCHELAQAGIVFARQVAIPVIYKALPIGDGFKADIVVARELILEIKAVAAISPVHEVQLRTYLRMSGIRIGLLLNFNAPRLTDGLRRYVV